MRRGSVNAGGVMVCGEVRSGRIHSVTRELAGKGRELADKKDTQLSCLLFFDELIDDPGDLFYYGVDRVLAVRHESLKYFNQEIAAKLLAHIVEMYLPEIVLAPATTAGRTYLPAAAAMLHTGLTADCTGLDIEEGSSLLLQTRPAIGGNVIATIKTPDYVPQMSTVRPKTFRIPLRMERIGEIVHPEVPADVFRSRIEVISVEYNDDVDINIQDKDVIISGGMGLKRAENFAIIRRLAEMLGGGVGASRPTVEAKWIDYPHQVGLSGKVVSPKLYLAVGISGAVQHLAGMQTAKKIVAVNKDPDAPIFRVADIALCGDAADILPRLIKRISEEVERR